MRRIRKGDTVRLKPNIFLMQKNDETARIVFIYRYQAHVSPALNSHTMLHVDSLERVYLRRRP